MCLSRLLIPFFGYIIGKLEQLLTLGIEPNDLSNLDRLIAIWQILHKDSWFDGTDPRDEDMGTFAIQRGHHDIPQDILRPFHKDSHGNYWTSVDVREVTALGYTYPRLQKWNYTSSDSSYDKESHIKDLTLELNNSYNSSRAAAEKERLTANPGESDGVGLMSLNSLIEVTKQELIDLTINDYVVNVIYEKYIFVPSPEAS